MQHHNHALKRKSFPGDGQADFYDSDGGQASGQQDSGSKRVRSYSGGPEDVRAVPALLYQRTDAFLTSGVNADFTFIRMQLFSCCSCGPAPAGNSAPALSHSSTTGASYCICALP